MKDAVFIPKGSLIVKWSIPLTNLRSNRQGRSSRSIFPRCSRRHLRRVPLGDCDCYGQFRTPRHIIQMMATMVNLRLVKPFVILRVVQQVSFLQYQQVLAANTSESHCSTDRFGIIHGTRGNKITNNEHWNILE